MTGLLVKITKYRNYMRPTLIRFNSLNIKTKFFSETLFVTHTVKI